MDLEDELRRSLAQQAARIEPSPRSVARLDAARPAGAPRLLAAAAILALVVVSAVILRTQSDDGGRTVSAGPEPSIADPTGTSTPPTSAPNAADACPTSDAGPPSPRVGAALASDGGGLLLFGGTDANGRALSDTWRYACGRWAQLAPTSKPPAAARPLAVFDTEAKEPRLIGDGGAVWAWQSGDWREVAAGGQLPALDDARSVYDSAARRTLVVGARDAALETWVLEGARWARLARTERLGRLRAYGLVHHRALGKTVLFGGVDDGDMLVSGTYMWDGNGWSGADNGGEAPQGPVTAGYDSKRSAVVAVDDIDARTWLWSGEWTLAAGVQAPGRLRGAAVAYDEGAEVLTLFGGDQLAVGSPAAPRRSNDVWRWDGRAWLGGPTRR